MEALVSQTQRADSRDLHVRNRGRPTERIWPDACRQVDSDSVVEELSAGPEPSAIDRARKEGLDPHWKLPTVSPHLKPERIMRRVQIPLAGRCTP